MDRGVTSAHVVRSQIVLVTIIECVGLFDCAMCSVFVLIGQEELSEQENVDEENIEHENIENEVLGIVREPF